MTTTELSPELLTGLRDLETPTVSDALDRLGIPGQCLGIMPLDRGFRMAGPAFTVKYCDDYVTGGSVGDFIDDIAPGQVAVLDNRGRLDVTVWGDLMTILAGRKGVAGTVVDGVCRDVRRALALDYPLFTRGNWMRTGKDRVQLEAVGVPVEIGGVVVRPGDVLVGDANGVVAVPAHRAEEVLAVAQDIEAAEERIREQVQNGVSLREARKQAGYHSLQTRVG
ncbi:RraA family protein [Streptomyces sp. NPDC002896]|uniref:RraA family protein n=1 Tax=Streptomyces sp. NPDC002896 TaxID=3154438 RepID=UPI00331B0FF9